jgi:DME family drug/metabolite transporter
LIAKEKVGVYCLLTAAMLWGTCGTAQTFAPQGYDPMVVGMMRIAIGGAVLFLLAVLRGELGPVATWPVKLSLLSAFSVAAFQLLFFNAVHQTGVAIGTIVGLGSAPIFAGILAFFFAGERPGRRWVIATLLAISGCCLLLLAGRTAPVAVRPTGIVLALGAGGCYAMYALTVKKLLANKSALAVMAVVASLGALMLLPLIWTRDFSWLAEPSGTAVALYLGVLTYALPMFLFAYGLTLTPVATAVTITLMEPLTAGLLGVLIVGEHFPLAAWCGLFMMLSGLFVLTVSVRRVTIDKERY